MKTDTPETDREDIIITKGKPTHWVSQEFARRLERERDEARKETIRTREFMDYGFAKAQEELTDMTAQRDRLAEALKELRNNDSLSLGGAAYEIVEQALQSLPPKP
jgi:predicted RNase H-like nuclease (RuvC/YqgF family)